MLLCPCCAVPMRLRPGRFGRSFWGCVNFPECQYLVTAHGDGTPMGVPADPKTRRARQVAHDLFDRLWRGYARNRPEVSASRDRRATASNLTRAQRARCYAWLAAQLGLDRDSCHIGCFDEATCLKVIEVVTGVGAADIERWAKRGGP